ncbi:MAG: L,D-transpeptidase [Paracoccaceae bacterium]
MKRRSYEQTNRRAFLVGTAATLTGLAAPALAQMPNSTEIEANPQPQSGVRHNISSFRTLNWQPYFADLHLGAILVDTTSRALHFWSEDGQTYKLYPTSVPMTDELTRRGRTEVVRKVVGPEWRPTASMKERNPDWPDYVPPGPDNPLGTHALYLSWTYYRIHGTQDTRKIGRRSSNGCIGLYNEDIAELFGYAKIGTQVLLI